MFQVLFIINWKTHITGTGKFFFKWTIPKGRFPRRVMQYSTHFAIAFAARVQVTTLPITDTPTPEGYGRHDWVWFDILTGSCLRESKFAFILWLGKKHSRLGGFLPEQGKAGTVQYSQLGRLFDG